MFTISVDESRNLVQFSSMRSFNTADAEKCIATLEKEVKKLRPGFTILTDLTQAEITDLSYIPFIERIMDICSHAGVSRIIRIIPDPANDIGFNILSRFHHKKDVMIIICKTHDEAAQYLS